MCSNNTQEFIDLHLTSSDVTDEYDLKRTAVQVTLCNGREIHGRFFGPTQMRCVDLLNRTERFIILKDGDDVFCINKEQIAMVRPL